MERACGDKIAGGGSLPFTLGEQHVFFQVTKTSSCNFPWLLAVASGYIMPFWCCWIGGGGVPLKDYVAVHGA